MRGIARETALLLDTGDAVRIARRLRSLQTIELEGFSAGMLRTAGRNLRAASYSLLVAARRFEHRADVLDLQRRRRST